MTIRPLRDLILARKYRRPGEVQYGSLLLVVPKAYEIDNSRSLWEVVAVGPRAEGPLGDPVQPGDILLTPPDRGVVIDRSLCIEYGEELFMLGSGEVKGHWPKTWSTECDSTA